MQASNAMAALALAVGASLALAAGSAGAAPPALDEQLDGAAPVISVPWNVDAAGTAAQAETLLAPTAWAEWSNVLGIDLRPGGSGMEFTSNPDYGTFWCSNGSSPAYAYARMHLPHGSTIRFFRMWGQDLSASGDVMAKLRETCLPNVGPAATPTVTDLATLQSSGSSGSFTVTSSPDHVVDNHQCAYVAYVQFPSCDATTSLRKLRVQYER
ncbi:hypothetical protein [Dokdonella sp.]|uniref:hypothetical protein n=1 Tax=Dokdonella sp. TaxID=2291710 RepID=UPI0025BDAB97|nr:hypothetical protein [Dokdonella sp.]MBX3688779.1 hypothetical protein [Dokdonella sp.]